MTNNLNIIFWGTNYYGKMASAHRIKNLIDPLVHYNDVMVYNLNRNELLPEINEQHPKVRAFSFDYNIKNPLSFFHFFYSIYKFLKKIRIKNSKNIFYCYGYPCIENIFIVYFARSLRYKIVFDIVEDVAFADLSKSAWHVKLYRDTSIKMKSYIRKWGVACFAISDYLVELCRTICKDQLPVYLLPICVDMPKIESYRDFKTEGKEYLTIFYGGSFGNKDGINFLVQGFELAEKMNPQLRLVLTGRISRQLEDEFNDIISQSSARDKINYLGCLPNDEFFTTMVNADILCMVRVNSEFASAGFPFKLGEYLASGKAVIATKVGNVEKYLRHKENAYLITPESPEDISEAILELASDKDLREGIGNRGKDVVKNNFDNTTVALSLYNILLSI